MRKKIQITSLILHNGYLGFLFGIPLYHGFLKGFCAPGLNCHSCPASLFACPIGMLQNSLATWRSLSFSSFFPGLAYTLGFLILWGVLLGRFICGWLCPFGLIQELFFKIPAPKIKISPSPWTRFFIKILIFFITIIMFPLFIEEGFYGVSAFCKYLCPAGTLEAAIPQLILQPGLRNLIGALFFFKLLVLFFILLSCTFEERFFCKTLCPLGLIYGLFNKISIINLVIRREKCRACKKCSKVCPADLQPYAQINSPECIRCLKCKEACPEQALLIGKG